MSSPQPVSYFEGTVTADQATGWKLQLLGPPLVVYGGTALLIGVEVRSIESPCTLRVQFRTSKVDPNDPDAFETSTVGSTISTNGTHPEVLDISGITGKIFLQPAVFTQLSSSSSPKTAFVRVWVTVLGGGWIVGRSRLRLEPGTSECEVGVGSPFASAGVSGLALGVTYVGIVGGVTDPNAAWRGFPTGNPAYPGSWTAGTETTDAAAGNSKELYEITPDSSARTLIQPGFNYSTTSGQYGMADILAVAKRS